MVFQNLVYIIVDIFLGQCIEGEQLCGDSCYNDNIYDCLPYEVIIELLVVINVLEYNFFTRMDFSSALKAFCFAGWIVMITTLLIVFNLRYL